MRHTASREPKFHQAEMLDGVGRSINELLTVFNRGCDFRILGAIIYFWMSRIVMRIVRAKDPRYGLIKPVWSVVEILVMVR